MDLQNQTRRRFLTQTSTAGGLGWLAYTFPVLLSVSELACQAHEDQTAFITFTPEEAADFAALAAQIIPSGDTPGATEAGVVYFADISLTQVDAIIPMLQPLRDGLADLRTRAQEKAGTASFAQLSDADQKELIGSIEASPLFFLARLITVCGLFAHPKYGGNQDKTGWKLIGLEDRHVWQPPFGYYDVDYDYEANYGEASK
ncbi:MAG: gluconate 2-dehydrogenase subunit 3 family protein [Rhodothermales bacterium]